MRPLGNRTQIVSPSTTRTTFTWIRLEGRDGFAQTACGLACAPEDALGLGLKPGDAAPARTSNDISSVPCWPPAEQFTIMGHRPGVVLLPTRQVQATMPRPSAILGTRPLALLG